jgi:hypothetical protein
MSNAPSYHDLHITTPSIPRTSIFNLPYGLEVTCTRVGGWCLWQHRDGRPPVTFTHPPEPVKVAGEYEGAKKWLVLDVAGHVIVDSRKEASDE